MKPKFSSKNIIETLIYRANKQPNSIAYNFFDGNDITTITWSSLAVRVNTLAVQIKMITKPEDRVILIATPGIDYIVGLFACFMAKVIVVPGQVPRTQRIMDWLDSVAANCEPSLILNDGAGNSALLKWHGAAHSLAQVPCLDIVQNSFAVDAPTSPVIASGSIAPECSVALLQYTSGSTGTPKGVMITYSNLQANMQAQQELYGVNQNSRGVIWLPPHHDMGLGSGILQPLWSGSSILLLAAAFAMQQPLRWLEAVDAFGATVSGGPPFAYAACVASLARNVIELKSLDLSRWSCAFVGAEPISPSIIDAFCLAFAPYGFRREAIVPSYGLAEATLLVAGANDGMRDIVHDCGRRLTFCGPAVDAHEILIVNPDNSCLRDPGAIGEIWISGPSVAKGYWRNPEATAATFEARLADGRGPYLRSGDLGMMVADSLIVTGRRKNVIIIAGRKVHAEDIEDTVRAGVGLLFNHYALAAVGIENEACERLVLFVEVPTISGFDHMTRDEFRRAATRIIAQHFDIRLDDVIFERRGMLPRTSSGKIRHSECAARYAAHNRAREVQAI